MYSLNQVNALVSCGRDPARSLPLRRGFLVIPLILVSFAFAPQMRAVSPPPDGCYGNFTTAEGCNALAHLSSGAGNTGVGRESLFFDTSGSFNTGMVAGALILNNADSNTAVGAVALLLNTRGTGPNTGTQNVAVGTDAMVCNYRRSPRRRQIITDAVGAFALFNNHDGFSNNDLGNYTVFENIHGAVNTAVGDLALEQ